MGLLRHLSPQMAMLDPAHQQQAVPQPVPPNIGLWGKIKAGNYDPQTGAGYTGGDRLSLIGSALGDLSRGTNTFSQDRQAMLGQRQQAMENDVRKEQTAYERNQPRYMQAGESIFQVGPQGVQTIHQGKKQPVSMDLGNEVVLRDPDTNAIISRFPKGISPNTAANISLKMGDDGTGKPSLSELRQWNNSYQDDVRAITANLGNARATIPYASAVINSGGTPPAGSNPRMSDVQLLRAAARAQTGPGVLTESEVFGTLSPSLQQEIMRQGAYFDASRVNLTPQDRLSLARNVQQGAMGAAHDLWERYESAEGVLGGRGVTPKDAGITPPEYPHPDDMASLNSPQGRYTAGRRYQGPTGRIYEYKGPGRWGYVGKGAAQAQPSKPDAPRRIKLD